MIVCKEEIPPVMFSVFRSFVLSICVGDVLHFPGNLLKSPKKKKPKLKLHVNPVGVVAVYKCDKSFQLRITKNRFMSF